MRRSSSLIPFLAMAAVVLTACGPEAARSGGPGLSVAVVPAVERDVQPGDTMEVGQLSDGFDRAALERTAATEEPGYLPPDAYAGADFGLENVQRAPMPTPVGLDLSPDEAYRNAASAGRSVRDLLADGSRMFGFDRPRPDYAAERAARWAARETQPAPEPATAASDTGPRPYTEVVKSSSE